MQEQVVDLMHKIFDGNQADAVPPSEAWWRVLAIFWVYRLQKPGKNPIVFDSTAQFEGISLLVQT